jgi:uncharacterized protein (TIGR03086 family)
VSTPYGATGLLAGAVSYALGACARLAPAELRRPTPCAQWDLAALLGHLAVSMADLETVLRTGHLDPGRPDRAVPAASDPAAGDPAAGDPAAGGPAGGDPAGGDPVEALRDRAADLLGTCYGYHWAGRFVRVGGLPLPAGLVACTGAVEIAVHGWDVAAARGCQRPIPAGLAARMLRLCPLLIAGREGLFGPPVQVPARAAPGDRLVGYLGRHPHAQPMVTGK